MNRFTLLLASAVSILSACAPTAAPEPSAERTLLLGGDVSMLPSYEEQGTIYKNEQGDSVQLLPYLKELGWNAIRVRLFVDPANAPEGHKGEGVCQDLDYVARYGKRIKDMGMRFMLDFHYSDTWADPGKQFIPNRWKDADVNTLPDSLYNYTAASLRSMVAAGATPDLIQVGNEITNGMIWPAAKVDPTGTESWPLLVRLLESGVKACREVCPEAQIIIHTEKAGDWNVTNAYYNNLRNLDYDIIGLSYYPMWHKAVGVLAATLDSLAVGYPDKEVMIVETAGYYSHDNDPWAKPDQYSEFYPITPEGQRIFTRELVSELKRHKNVTGLFWWFPEENGYGNEVVKGWLNRGLFDNKTGRVLPAMKEFNDFINQ